MFLSRDYSELHHEGHSGVLAPPEANAHKMKLSKKHRIMASMFSGDDTKTNTGKTLELSLEINRQSWRTLY